MTVETTDRKQTFSGGQSSLTFAFRTLVSNPEYIKVLVRLLTTGAETDLVYGVGFTVAINSDGVGGVVTVSPTYSTAYNYVVYRETPAVQTADFDDYNQFPADTVENGFDRTIMIAQEQQEENTRTLRYPISISGTDAELPSPEASSFIRWNSAGDGLENAAIPDPSTLVKATASDATTATDDTKFMTPSKVKTEVENPGTVSIPAGNIQTVTVTKGGTGISTYAQGDILYASAVTTLAKLAAGTAGQALTTGGAGANPAFAGMTTQGDIEYHNGTTRTRLPPGTSGQYLKSNGAAANPSWTDAPTISSGRIVITTSGTVNIPTGVNTVYLTMCGGGGGGGGINDSNGGGGGGGGGGGTISFPYTVTSGGSVVVAIGTGGSGGGSGSTGSTGGTTTFGAISCAGGAGGQGGAAISGTGGAGGNASGPAGFAGTAAVASAAAAAGGVGRFAGGTGGVGASGGAGSCRGGGGGGSTCGQGGAGSAATGSGVSAAANSGGGGGGGSEAGTSGGSGGSGIIIMEY